MPFESIIALSRRPELLRAWMRHSLAVLLGLGLNVGALAQEGSASQTTAKMEAKAGTNTADSAPVGAAPADARRAGTNAAPEAKAAPAPATASGKSGSPATAQAKSASTNIPPTSYEAFRLVADRNIFNPGRTRRSRAGDGEAPPPPPKVESFALVGTIKYEKGTFAFFDSSSSTYRKTAKAGDTVGDCKLKAVEDNKVTIEADGKDVDLKVGMQLRREEAGPWAASIRTETSSSFASSSPSSSFGASSGSSNGDSSRSGFSRTRGSRGGSGGGEERRTDTPPPSGGEGAPAPPSGGGDSGGASDILKRMMEQRQREMNR